MILITTAGKVGAEAAVLLARREVPYFTTPVRVLVRDPDKARALAEVGVEVVQGDLEDPSSVADAMSGVTTVVLVSPAVPAQELNVIDAAARVGVKHVVKVTSKASADSPIARRRGQAEIERGLIASGLPHTLLRANAYMQNFLMLAPVIAKLSSFGSSAGTGLVGLIDARDVGAVAAEVAASPEGHAGKTYCLTGPELLSYGDVANVLTQVLHRKVSYQERTFEEDRQAMIAAGVPEPIAEMNAQAFSLIATGDAEWLSDDVASILGRSPRSFGRFVADYAAAFS